MWHSGGSFLCANIISTVSFISCIVLKVLRGHQPVGEGKDGRWTKGNEERQSCFREVDHRIRETKHTWDDLRTIRHLPLCVKAPARQLNPRVMKSSQGATKASLVIKRLNWVIRKEAVTQTCPELIINSLIGNRTRPFLSINLNNFPVLLPLPGGVLDFKGALLGWLTPLCFINCCPRVVGYPVFWIGMRILDASEQHGDM